MRIRVDKEPDARSQGLEPVRLCDGTPAAMAPTNVPARDATALVPPHLLVIGGGIVTYSQTNEEVVQRLCSTDALDWEKRVELSEAKFSLTLQV